MCENARSELCGGMGEGGDRAAEASRKVRMLAGRHGHMLRKGALNLSLLPCCLYCRAIEIIVSIGTAFVVSGAALVPNFLLLLLRQCQAAGNAENQGAFFFCDRMTQPTFAKRVSMSAKPAATVTFTCSATVASSSAVGRFSVAGGGKSDRGDVRKQATQRECQHCANHGIMAGSHCKNRSWATLAQ